VIYRHKNSIGLLNPMQYFRKEMEPFPSRHAA